MKNTGRKVIETNQYNHNFFNFFVIDHEVVGPDIVVKFVFTPNPVRGSRIAPEVHGQEIVFPDELKAKNGVFSELGDGHSSERLRFSNREFERWSRGSNNQ